MKEKSMKRMYTRICSWLLIAAMTFESLFANEMIVYGATVSNNGEQIEEVEVAKSEAKRTHISSSDLSVPQSWTLDISDFALTAVLNDTRTDMSLNAMLMLLEKEETDYSKYLNRVSGKLNNHTCTMTLNLSTVEPGTYKLIFWEKMTNSTYSGMLGSYLIEVTEGGCYFANPTLGEVEEAFMENVQMSCDPELYANIPYQYYDSVNNLDEMIQAAEEITSSCETDLEKVIAVKDWFGEQVSYDWSDMENSRDPDWVFQNLRATCTGYSKLFQIMITSLGVPCVLVDGYAASSDSLGTEENYSTPNHMWTLVYLDSSWHNVDLAGNTQNQYFGENSESNQSGNLGVYRYFGIAPMDLSLTHHFNRVYTFYSGVANLEFLDQPETTEFYQGDAFTFDGTVQLVDLAGEKHKSDVVNENLTFSGYDLNVIGTQTVKVSYCNLELEYEITVKPPKTEESGNAKIQFSTEPATTVFEQGDEFVFDGSVSYVDANNESHPISNEDANLVISGYDLNKVGKQTVTIQYYDFSLQYEIVVNEPDISGIYISGENLAVNKEATFSVPVKLTNNSGVMGLGLDISYDATVFEEPKVTRGAVLADGTFNDSITSETAGSFKVLWSGTEQVTTDGELLTLEFTVKKDIEAGDYTINIKNRKGDTFDEDYEDVDIKCLPVTVTVKEQTQEEEAAEKLTQSKTTAKAGLDSYVNLQEYDATQQLKLQDIINQAKSAIENAKTEDEVETIVAEAKQKMDALSKTSESSGGSSTGNGSTTGNASTGNNTSTGGNTSTGNNTSSQSSNQSASPSPAKVGTVLKDSKGKAKYKVTSSSKNNPKVEFVSLINKKVTKATIPSSITVDGITYKVTSIAPNAFKNNKKLKKITIGINVENIGKKAFYGCTSLKTVANGYSIKTIGDSAFQGCKKLNDIPILEVKTIGKKAFYNCKKLEEVLLLSTSLKKVGSKAFYNIHKNAVIYVYESKYKKQIKILKKAYQKTTEIIKY